MNLRGRDQKGQMKADEIRKSLLEGVAQLLYKRRSGTFELQDSNGNELQRVLSPTGEKLRKEIPLFEKKDSVEIYKVTSYDLVGVKK